MHKNILIFLKSTFGPDTIYLHKTIKSKASKKFMSAVIKQLLL